MRAKFINENLDPTKESLGNLNYIGYEENEYGTIVYVFNDHSGRYGVTGKISVDIWDIAKFYGISEDEMENNPHAITSEQIDNYVTQLNINEIEWEEDEGPNPDEMRDFRYDR